MMMRMRILREDLIRFMNVNEMYNLLIEEPKLDGREDTERNLSNFHNVEVKYSVTCYNLVDHEESLVNIDVSNLFQWVLSTIVDVENNVIGNV